MEMVFNPQNRTPIIIGATGMTAIIQNLRVILMTLRCSIPLDRAFAHDGKMIDSPAPLETARRTADLIEAIEKYEPRVKVEKLEFVYHNAEGQLQEGMLTPRLTFSLARGGGSVMLFGFPFNVPQS